MNTTIEIPVKDNPSHVDNLKSIELLKTQGFEGMDASLEESLFEYGLAWRAINDGKEFLFIYRHPSIAGNFERCTMNADTCVRKEYDWVDWPGLMSFLVGDFDTWLELPLPHKISDLVFYCGTEEIFGSVYWEGFTIRNPQDEE